MVMTFYSYVRRTRTTPPDTPPTLPPTTPPKADTSKDTQADMEADTRILVHEYTGKKELFLWVFIFN